MGLLLAIGMSSAFADSMIYDLVEVGDEFEFIKKEGDWYQINYNGQTGYLNAEYVEEVE